MRINCGCLVGLAFSLPPDFSRRLPGWRVLITWAAWQPQARFSSSPVPDDTNAVLVHLESPTPSPLSGTATYR